MTDPSATAQQVSALSPCIGVCVLQGDMCMGCGRTVTEITLWPTATLSDQQRIVRRAGERLAQQSRAL